MVDQSLLLSEILCIIANLQLKLARYNLAYKYIEAGIFQIEFCALRYNQPNEDTLKN